MSDQSGDKGTVLMPYEVDSATVATTRGVKRRGGSVFESDVVPEWTAGGPTVSTGMPHEGVQCFRLN